MSQPAAQPAAQGESDSHANTRRWIVWIARAITYVVYAYVIFVQIILGLGFFLLLFGANPTNDFVTWVYRSLERAMSPFRGIFQPIDLGTTSGGEVPSVFDTSILFAMIVYAIIAIAIHALIRWLSFRLQKLERQMAIEQQAELEQQAYQPTAADFPSQPATQPSATDIPNQPAGQTAAPTSPPTAPPATPDAAPPTS